MRLTSNLKEYIESKCYTKAEIDEAIGNITQFDYQMVDELPSTGVKGTIYMLQNNNEDSDNLFDGYLFVNNRWELVGPRIDLSNYYTQSEVNNLLTNKVGFSDEVSASKNGVMTSAMKNKLDNIEEEANKTVISPIPTTEGKRTKIATINNTDIYVPADDNLSDSSSNPVQNKTVDVAISNLQTNINGKANTMHTHTKQDIINLLLASSNADGLMSKEDKIKLDGLDTESASLIDSISNGVFVSSNGSDSTGNGSFTKPYATINKAEQQVADNGIVYVFGGEYTERGLGYGAVGSTYSIIGLGEVNITLTYSVGAGATYAPKSITLENINIIGYSGNAINGALIELDGNGEFIAKNCSFENITIPIIGSTSSDRVSYLTGNKVVLEDCVFKGNSLANAFQYRSIIYRIENLQINNCEFYNNTVINGALIEACYIGKSIKINNSVFKENTGAIIKDNILDSEHYTNSIIIRDSLFLENNSSNICNITKYSEVYCIGSYFADNTLTQPIFSCNGQTKLYANIFETSVSVINSSASSMQKGNIVNGVSDYDSVATSSANGLMSSTDKTKLDGMGTIPMVVTFSDDTIVTYNIYKSG